MNDALLEPLVLSLVVSLIGTLAATIVGVAVAGAVSSRAIPFATFFETLVVAPMVLPPTVLGTFLLVAIGRGSSVGRAWEALFGAPLVFSTTAAVLACFLAALPLVARTARAAMDDVSLEQRGAAATLGATPLVVFFTIVLPESAGGIFAGVSLGFARALGDFGVTLMIAGNIPGLTQTGALAIYDAVLGGRDLDAVRLSLALASLAIVALVVGQRLARKSTHGF